MENRADNATEREHDDILDNMLEQDGEDHFLFGDKQPPDHDPGKRSGCLAGILLYLGTPILAYWAMTSL